MYRLFDAFESNNVKSLLLFRRRDELLLVVVSSSSSSTIHQIAVSAAVAGGRQLCFGGSARDLLCSASPIWFTSPLIERYVSTDSFTTSLASLG